MNRRNFLAGSAAAAIPAAAANDNPENQYIALTFYDLRRDRTNQSRRLSSFFKDVHLPMTKRHQLGPVGYFNVSIGPAMPTVITVLALSSLSELDRITKELADDQDWQKGAQAAEAEHPAFDRVQGWLLRAFDGMPKVEPPPIVPGKAPRFFDLRIYESATFEAHARKLDMFNNGGEIDIFRRSGLNPVFFGATKFGDKMPNLAYMVCYDDYAAREKAWAKFRADPDWKKISKDPKWANTVTNITDLFLQPLPFSPIR